MKKHENPKQYSAHTLQNQFLLSFIKLTSSFIHFSELAEKLTSNSQQQSFQTISLRNLGRFYRSRFQLSYGELEPFIYFCQLYILPLFQEIKTAYKRISTLSPQQLFEVGYLRETERGPHQEMFPWQKVDLKLSFSSSIPIPQLLYNFGN